MNDFSYDDEIINDFCIEAKEMIELTNDDLLDLEEQYSIEKINRIFRTFHTIKGNSAMLGFEKLSDFAHKSENLLSEIRNSKIIIDKKTIDLLFKIVDFISIGIDEINSSSKDIDYVDDILIESINDLILSGNDKTTNNIVKPIKREKNNYRFLIVEDDFINRTILHKTLGKYGDCQIAVNGEEAVAAFLMSIEENNHYDIIFMDINMPKMNGIDASIKIRNIEHENNIFGKKEVKIVIVSTNNNPRDIIKTIYKCGATTYIVKPYSIDKIKNEIENLA